MSIFKDIKKGRIPGTKKRIPGVKEIKKGVDIPKQVANEVEKLVPDAVKKELSNTIKTALQTFFKILFAPLNRKAINILKAAAPDAVGVSIGIVTLKIDDVHEKIDEIQYWINNPPLSESKLIDMVRDLAPSEIELSLRGNIPGLSVGVGATISYVPEEFIKRLPDIWDEIKDFI